MTVLVNLNSPRATVAKITENICKLAEFVFPSYLPGGQPDERTICIRGCNCAGNNSTTPRGPARADGAKKASGDDLVPLGGSGCGCFYEQQQGSP